MSSTRLLCLLGGFLSDVDFGEGQEEGAIVLPTIFISFNQKTKTITHKQLTTEDMADNLTI